MKTFLYILRIILWIPFGLLINATANGIVFIESLLTIPWLFIEWIQSGKFDTILIVPFGLLLKFPENN